jgi:hypothetical protein
MICTGAQCLCSATTYYVAPNCVSRNTYGGSCTSINQCYTTLGLVCTSSTCQCSSSQYWSTLTNGTSICANLRTLGQSCTTYTDCQNSSTSVKCISNLCECDYSGFYLDQATVTCQPLIALGGACTYNFQCASFNCNTSFVCGSTIASTIMSNVSQAAASATSFRYAHVNIIQYLFWFFIITLYFILLVI